MIDLFDYNQEAYNSGIVLLREKKRAAIIHPTGTGKSFIGFKLCEEHSDRCVCWLSPSEYIFKNQLENLKQTGAEIPQNIIFLTYVKLMLLDAEQLQEIQPDYIILDEFHRCGAQMWGQGVLNFLELYKEASVLGLSATHIRYLDNQRDMAEELFGGNIASEMTLGEAIVRGILPSPNYITTLYSYQEELMKYEQRMQRTKSKVMRDSAEKYLAQLRRALEKAEGLDKIFQRHMEDANGKYLVFCANKEHLDEMIENSKMWFGNIDEVPHLYSVYSDDIESEESFQKFKADESKHLKLLFCIDMLNEGVHIDGISGVIMFRPTISPIIYKQQIGRALSAASGTVPVIFDIVNNIENLYTIDALEQEMKEAVVYYRENHRMEEVITDRFTVYEELHDCRQLFQKLNDMLSTSWEMMYVLASEFYNENQHLEVPKRYKTKEGYSLGSWISIQRRVRNGEVAGNLDESRIQKLDEIKMNWESYNDASFQKHYESAQLYYEKYQNLDINIDYITEDGIKLGAWIAGIRKKNSMGTLSQEHKNRLEEMGMIWDKFSYLWEQGYLAASSHYEAYGSLEMRSTFIDANGYKLGAWLNSQKRLKKEDKLDQHQIQRLDDLGIQWLSKYDAKWNAGYEEAKTYYLEKGNLEVPVAYETATGFRLGAWLASHREKNGMKVTAERRLRLDQIGMIWTLKDVKNSWNIRYELARSFYIKEKHLQIPSQYIVDGIWLNKWVNEQKQIYHGNRKGKSLTEEQIEQLESIGIEWLPVRRKTG